jgi:hypothetical protein
MRHQYFFYATPYGYSSGGERILGHPEGGGIGTLGQIE